MDGQVDESDQRSKESDGWIVGRGEWRRSQTTVVTIGGHVANDFAVDGNAGLLGVE